MMTNNCREAIVSFVRANRYATPLDLVGWLWPKSQQKYKKAQTVKRHCALLVKDGRIRPVGEGWCVR